MKSKLQEQIGWLEKLVIGLKTLDNTEFSYSDYVKSYNKQEENICGTVCCAFGWMPKFVPESGVTFRKLIGFVETYYVDNIFSEINQHYIKFMFFGSYLYAEIEDSDESDETFGPGLHSNLEQVINRIEYVINRLNDLIKDGKLS